MKTLIAVSYSDREYTKEQVSKIHAKAHDRSIAGMTMTMRSESGRTGYALMIFDVYVVEHLSLAQRARHVMRKIKATILGYVGVNPIRIIIA